MYSLLLLAFSSFVLALLLTPLIRNLFRRWGLVDRPDGGRHLHAYPIPRIGGIPIVAAYLGAFALLLALPLAAGGILIKSLPLVSKILPAAALVFALGLVDDLRGLKPWQKFLWQGLAAGVAYWGGVHVTGVAGLTMSHWLSLPLTLLWLVGCSNAFNLIDGVDGLAAGAGLFTTVTILLGALLHNNVPLAMATVPLAGALLGFLRFNFNPASIFLGDSGSLTVGFLLGCFAVLWAEKSTTMLGMTAPLMALAVPLLDTAIAIARRFLRQQPISRADSMHIHHRLLARGFTPRRVALLLYAACGLAATMSLLASVSQNQFKGAIIVIFCAAAWIGVQHLGYVEFGVAGRMVLPAASGACSSPRAYPAPTGAANTWLKSRTPEARWQSVVGDHANPWVFIPAAQGLQLTRCLAVVYSKHCAEPSRTPPGLSALTLHPLRRPPLPLMRAVAPGPRRTPRSASARFRRPLRRRGR